MKFAPVATAALWAIASITAGCRTEKPIRERERVLGSGSDSAVVTVIAGDYAFRAPAEIPSGVVTFRMVNEGEAPHMMAVHRLTGQHTLAELLAHIRQHKWEPDWAPILGGPNAVGHGDTSNATIRLEPGRYVLICWVETAEKEFHLLKGMLAEVRATASQPVRSEPEADVVITLADYRITPSRTVERGERVFKVVNAGAQQHDVQLIRLNPGASLQSALRWFETGAGASPGRLLGGLAGINPGSAGYFTADVTPGRYALFCFVPDSTGKPHFLRGMHTVVVVR